MRTRVFARLACSGHSSFLSKVRYLCEIGKSDMTFMYSIQCLQSNKKENYGVATHLINTLSNNLNLLKSNELIIDAVRS